MKRLKEQREVYAVKLDRDDGGEPFFANGYHAAKLQFFSPVEATDWLKAAEAHHLTGQVVKVRVTIEELPPKPRKKAAKP